MEPESSPPAPDSGPPNDLTTPPTEPPRRHFALLGLVAAGAGLAASEVVAGLFLSAPSLILTIGQRFIDVTPPALKDWAIAVFGTSDKAVFIGIMTVVALAFGALLGLASRRFPGPAAAGFVLFGAIGYAAGITDPLADPMPTLLAAAAAAAAGGGAMLGLRSLLHRPSPPPAETSPALESRRLFLTSSAAAAALAVGAAALGRSLTNRTRAAVAGREQVTLPSAAPSPPAPAATAADAAEPAASSAPATSAPEAEAAPVSTVPDPTPAQTADVPGVSELITPNDDFYVIDTALSVPQVDIETWSVSFMGRVDRPFSLTYDELLAMPMVERYVTLCCVSNSVGGGLVGNAKWLGVPLRELVERAGVGPEGGQLVGRSVDGFTVGFPTEAVFDGREALLAVGMNGEPLPLRHGFPARLVVSGLYGYVSATKWLSEVEFTGWDDFDAYWIPRGWAKEAPIKTQSRIDTPRQGATIPAGPNVIAGVAWAQNRGVERVEVQVDDGPWVEADLPEELSIDSWRQWHVTHDFGPGRHRIAVRAADATGETQTAEIRPPRPDGATGYHTIGVEAAG